MRTAELGLLATKKLTVPNPVPEFPEVTSIQLTLLVAIHEQAPEVETLAVPLKPPEVDIVFPSVTP